MYFAAVEGLYLLVTLSAGIEGHTLDDTDYLDENDYWE